MNQNLLAFVYGNRTNLKELRDLLFINSDERQFGSFWLLTEERIERAVQLPASEIVQRILGVIKKEWSIGLVCFNDRERSSNLLSASTIDKEYQGSLEDNIHLLFDGFIENREFVKDTFNLFTVRNDAELFKNLFKISLLVNNDVESSVNWLTNLIFGSLFSFSYILPSEIIVVNSDFPIWWRTSKFYNEMVFSSRVLAEHEDFLYQYLKPYSFVHVELNREIGTGYLKFKESSLSQTTFKVDDKKSFVFKQKVITLFKDNLKTILNIYALRKIFNFDSIYVVSPYKDNENIKMLRNLVGIKIIEVSDVDINKLNKILELELLLPLVEDKQIKYIMMDGNSNILSYLNKVQKIESKYNQVEIIPYIYDDNLTTYVNEIGFPFEKFKNLKGVE